MFLISIEKVLLSGNRLLSWNELRATHVIKLKCFNRIVKIYLKVS